MGIQHQQWALWALWALALGSLDHWITYKSQRSLAGPWISRKLEWLSCRCFNTCLSKVQESPSSLQVYTWIPPSLTRFLIDTVSTRLWIYPNSIQTCHYQEYPSQSRASQDQQHPLPEARISTPNAKSSEHQIIKKKGDSDVQLALYWACPPKRLTPPPSRN